MVMAGWISLEQPEKVLFSSGRRQEKYRMLGAMAIITRAIFREPESGCQSIQGAQGEQ
jgi:hypothetical protein